MKFLTMDLDSAPQVSAIFHVPRVCDFDSIAIINLRIYMGFHRQIRSGCNFTPSLIIHDLL